MIVSEKSHQNLLGYIEFSLKRKFDLIKKGIISTEKKREIQVIITIIMLTRSTERIFKFKSLYG